MLESDPVKIHFNMLRPRLFGFMPPVTSNEQLWCMKGLEQLKNDAELPALIDFKSFLPDAMLYKVDRSSMASSLEVRVPYLDNMMIGYALKLNFSDKSTNRHKNKSPLKNLLANLAPHYDINKPKKGFSFPLTHWLKTDWKEMVLEAITKSSLEDIGLDPGPYMNILNGFYNKNVNCTNEVWYLFNLILWHRSFKKISGLTQ